MEEREQERIISRIREAEAWRDSNYGALWQDCLRRYRSQPERRREGSNIFVPQTFMQSEVIKSRIAESLFAERPYLTVLPREGSDAAKAQSVQMLLDWQLNDCLDLPRLVGESILSSLVIYGTAVTYTGWEVKNRRVRKSCWEQQPVLGSDGQQLQDELGEPLNLLQEQVLDEVQTIYDDPVVVAVPLADFFCDTRADKVESARFCGHREYLTRAVLDDMAAQGKYTIDWEALEKAEEDEMGGGFLPQENKGLYLVHHYWEDERHLVFINYSQCVCEEENPFWHGMKPYDKCCYVELEGEFFGMGVPEILAGLQDELNTSRNQRIDYNSLSLRRMWKLRKGCGLNARDLIWRQNGVLQVENMDDVQEINIQSLPGDAFANEAGIKQDMQDVTGCHDIIMGVAYSNETATTTMTRDNNASLRFKTAVRSLIKDLLIPIARKCVALDQQFLTEARLLRLLNQPAAEMFRCSPEEIAGEYDIIYCGTAVESQANKSLAKEKLLQAYSLALADPAYQADDLARMKLFRKVLSALDIAEADDLMPQVRVGQPS